MWEDDGAGGDLMAGLDAVRLIGRDAESAQLYDAMTAAGDAGIGKSTLVTDLALRAADLGAARPR